jgi:hypothetical protein
VATRVLCGCSAAEAAKVNDEALIDLPAGDEPAYEIWRQRIRAQYTKATPARSERIR